MARRPYVASLVRTRVGVLATLSTGDHYQLWQTGDGRSWRQLVVPLEPQTAGDHALVAAAGDELLLVGDAATAVTSGAARSLPPTRQDQGGGSDTDQTSGPVPARVHA